MGKLNVMQFATELGLPVALLLEQLKAAGIAKEQESDPVSEQDKAKLLEHFRLAHGANIPAKKITLTRRETTETKNSDSSERARTIQVEVKKRQVEPVTAVEAAMSIELTLIELIQRTKNIPSDLSKLSDDFLALGVNYNSTVEKLKHKKLSTVTKLEDEKSSIVKELNDEKYSIIENLEGVKSSIQQSYNGTLSLLRSQHEKTILAKKEDVKNGNYMLPILEIKGGEWKGKETTYFYLQWGFVATGVIFLFFIKWYLGFLIGGLSFVFKSMRESANWTYNKIHNEKQSVAKSTLLTNAITDIPYDVKEAIKAGAAKEQQALENLVNSLADEFKVTERKEALVLQQGLSDLERKRQQMRSAFEIKQQQMLSAFEIKQQQELSDLGKILQLDTSGLVSATNDNVDKITSCLELLVHDLNQLPETFDNNLLEWKDESILKAQEMVAYNLRIGQEMINIVTDSTHSIAVPRCIPFFNRSNIVINCTNQEETDRAIQVTHNIIARTLLSLQANKTKITFIDPLKLGGNAAPFTPLIKDIYGGRIFTQADDIENQLSILTRAIENIIQRYLNGSTKGKFPDLATYNLETKEVPEPYRLLVVYNFPHGFNDTSAKKLLNVISSGPKAGIHTILVNDRNAELPYGLGKSGWDAFREGFSEISLSKARERNCEFDNNLPFNEIVDFVNKEFPNVNTLKVPFTKYIDAKTDWWKCKAHEQFSVPIGRHGADVQVLQFDNDDDNQALLIGKPGSGKSNLLHVIIANSLWKYSPDQLEIHLIDFKGGVEFTIYADKKIPHIRTIAIESEREFGLSVLDGVEQELLKREKEFNRALGGTGSKLNEYHEKFPSERMPRILLIVDEFQEFFTEDDDIKQSVDAKFDRIIKKGRAFGINTLFSSQTLSGNSIQKSTRELIDIRIALMCSDTDANQILDDRNPAARDLTRPGEGIYNPDNGKVSGNNKFQAFFVEKDELYKTIEEVVDFANSQPKGNNHFKQTIFRGSEKAHLNKEGHPLANVSVSATPKSLKLWLGEPVAIADDVIATLRKQGGSNLLVAGYDEGTGLRVMASSVISVAAQHQQDTAKFYYFNFFNVDSELVNVPHELFNNIQQQSENVGSRDVKNALQAIKDDIEKRLLEGASNNHNIYLVFFSFQRGRAFRKDGYTMSGEGDLLSFILKEGPDVGVFTMVQVDTMDNFSKNLDDNLLREFSQRVASQMNPDNSVKIIGNQKASKLSNNRAWYYDDNENTLTKFKPYELPSYSWVLQLQNKSTVVLS